MPNITSFPIPSVPAASVASELRTAIGASPGPTLILRLDNGSASQSSINGEETLLTPTSTSDPYSVYTPSTGIIIIPSDGFYCFTHTHVIADSPAFAEIYIKLNNVRVAYESIAYLRGDAAINNSPIFFFATSGQQMKMFSLSTGDDFTIGGSNGWFKSDLIKM